MNNLSLVEQIQYFPLRKVRVGNLDIAYRSAGAGPVIVLLHGISSGSGSWINQLNQLSSQYQVVAWDAPGYGQSDDLNTKEPSAVDYADVLHGFINALALKKPILIGHSLGALIGSAFACHYSEDISGLILADPAQGYGNAHSDQQSAVFRQRPQMLEELGPEGLAEKRAHALLSKKATTEKVQLVADGMRRLRLNGFTCASYLLAYDDIWRYLSSYRRTVLVLCGDEDDITPPVSAIALSERCCRALYVSIGAAGHASYIDSPDAFNHAISKFCLVQQSGETVFSGVKNEL